SLDCLSCTLTSIEEPLCQKCGLNLAEEVYQGHFRQTGFLPNVFKVLSHWPLEYRAFFAYYNVICNKKTGQLSRADKELIILVTSLANRCSYSVVVHSAWYRVFSKNPVLSDQVCINWRKSDLPAWEKAMLEFALAISQADDVTDDHFKKLEVHGFNQEDA
uniref:Carboxymuconolactone decarboxylase-like domain-containing protein n=1 Tax=Capra hircus TaxID=9925 RepID=A0A8C2NMP7_CAPHI